ncbi:hypothetical protein SISNIDRAFT_304741 [Sistotremastrum niveocremeum HHB9708]|uniref:Uncharacterized protein n=1 Tax=Sistotremastrum niveocremeum HHB9708 TaxID=1314777 RepID=A0A164N2X9_9AGAM|nr:hypothetical protein SISNIDRAFT_304741 [Sistotremastrum niveocremeum HHB9708]
MPTMYSCPRPSKCGTAACAGSCAACTCASCKNHTHGATVSLVFFPTWRLRVELEVDSAVTNYVRESVHARRRLSPSYISDLCLEYPSSKYVPAQS